LRRQARHARSISLKTRRHDPVLRIRSCAPGLERSLNVKIYSAPSSSSQQNK
jgi:hypothetical protein